MICLAVISFLLIRAVKARSGVLMDKDGKKFHKNDKGMELKVMVAWQKVLSPFSWGFLGVYPLRTREFTWKTFFEGGSSNSSHRQTKLHFRSCAGRLYWLSRDLHHVGHVVDKLPDQMFSVLSIMNNNKDAQHNVNRLTSQQSTKFPIHVSLLA